MKIDIEFLFIKNENPFTIISKNDHIIIKCYFITSNISNYMISTNMNNINNIMTAYIDITHINITFDTKIKNEHTINKIITILNDMIYKYHLPEPIVTLNNVTKKTLGLMNELKKYKDIVMDPNKNPDSYLKYILSRIPKTYKTNIYKIKPNNDITNKFPLVKSVGAGSSYNAYFVHVEPKKINNKKKNIYLIGKAVTFDSGGMNLKGDHSSIEDMKVDMTGSAIITSVLYLLHENEEDINYNIHLIIPIVENMISNTATRPGMTIKTMSKKFIEIIDTDAEGRLCMVDALDYINLHLINKKADNIIIDIATLTGNTIYISNGISSIIMGNNKSMSYCNQMVEIGEIVGDYVDYLKLRPEYNDYLNTHVGDIANISKEAKCGCIIGGTFLNYFADTNIPWIHIDVASTTFINRIPTCYGINLLYYFIKNL